VLTGAGGVAGVCGAAVAIIAVHRVATAAAPVDTTGLADGAGVAVVAAAPNDWDLFAAHQWIAAIAEAGPRRTLADRGGACTAAPVSFAPIVLSAEVTVLAERVEIYRVVAKKTRWVTEVFGAGVAILAVHGHALTATADLAAVAVGAGISVVAALSHQDPMGAAPGAEFTGVGGAVAAIVTVRVAAAGAHRRHAAFEQITDLRVVAARVLCHVLAEAVAGVAAVHGAADLVVAGSTLDGGGSTGADKTREA